MKKLWLEHRRLFLIAALSIICITLVLIIRYHVVYWPGQSAHYSTGQLVIVPVNKMDKPIPIIFSGTIEGHKAATVSADSLGQVTEVYVKEGDQVKAGQPLLSIETMTRTITVAAGINAAASSGDQAGVESNQQNSSQYAALEKEYNRYQKLYEQGAIARKKVDEAAARLQAAQDAATAPHSAPISSTETGDAANTQTIAGGLTKLTAPTDGIVTGLSLVPGNSVQTGQQLLTLSNGTGVQTIIQLSQKDLYFVRSGSKAEISSDALPGQVLAGQVESIFPGTNQLFRTQIRIDNPSGVLQPGMPVNVRFYTTQTIPVSVVPKTAVFTENGQSYIYVASNGKALKQEVTVGDFVGDFLEILSTLPEKALIVTGNISALKNGDSLPLQ